MRRIKQITITNLFGMFNYVIPLHLDDRITIIHGPNGFGKTIILKLLSEIFSRSELNFLGRNNPTLRTIPFDKFLLDFDDGYSFWITKSFQSISTVSFSTKYEDVLIPRISFYDSNHSNEEQALTLNLRPLFHSIQLALATQKISLSSIESAIPGLEYVSSNHWKFHPTNEELSLEEVVEWFGDQLPISLPSTKEPAWLSEIRSSIPIRFIETQRLYRLIDNMNERVEEPTVITYSKELIRRTKAKLAESVALAQSLDRTFPARVVSPTNRNHYLTDDELRQKLIDLEHKRSQLIATGLLDKDDNANFQVGDQIDEGAKTALSIYVEDTEKKLAIFDDIANKIELLTSIVNKRFLFKRMEIGKEQGFIFTTSIGTKLLLESLSSGEQHELVLFYELLFKVPPGSLILIDEPELSLHVVWQEHFLHDVQEITRLSDIDVLLATHSPDLISDRRDLVVELEGPK